MMSSAAVHLVAYDLLEVALEAGSIGDAIEPLQRDLEVLPRDELVRVAMALAVEATLRLTPAGERPRLAERVQKARLHAMWSVS